MNGGGAMRQMTWDELCAEMVKQRERADTAERRAEEEAQDAANARQLFKNYRDAYISEHERVTALEAELKDWKGLADRTATAIAEYGAMREKAEDRAAALEAENSDLRQWLQAEKTGCAELRELIDGYHKQRDEAEAENRRLREAIKTQDPKIGGIALVLRGQGSPDLSEELRGIADKLREAALAPQAGPGAEGPKEAGAEQAKRADENQAWALRERARVDELSYAGRELAKDKTYWMAQAAALEAERDKNREWALAAEAEVRQLKQEHVEQAVKRDALEAENRRLRAVLVHWKSKTTYQSKPEPGSFAAEVDAALAPQAGPVPVESNDAIPPGEAWLIAPGKDGPEIKAKIVNMGKAQAGPGAEGPEEAGA